MAPSILEGEPSQAERFEAEAEAGIGANAQTVDQTQQSNRTDEEKTLNETGLSPSASSERVIEEQKTGPPPQEEKKRSKGKIVLLMLALCVCLFTTMHVKHRQANTHN